MLNDLLIDTNGYVLNLLKKIFNADIEIIGSENIPLENPKMFVANHFTRIEAMLVPYSLYNITNKKVGVIADDSLFKTIFGDFLRNLGAMKKSEPNRNEHIIGDLITSCKDWMIFPEGMMIKAKDISRIDKNFCVKIDGACQRVHTGAGVFSLTSQLFRQEYLDNKIENFNSFSEKYFIEDCKQISTKETMIVPINISYTKLRNEKNFLIDMAESFMDDIDENFKEELNIESNIVLNSKIVIKILKPISTVDIIKSIYTKNLSTFEIVNKLKYEITHNFMNKIYESLTINFDHIFVLILFLYPKKQIEINYFKRLIYLTIQALKNENLFLDDELLNDDLIYLISYEKYARYEDISDLAIKDKIVKKDEKFLEINKENLLNSYTHHTIRINNILRVILNEIQINEKIVEITNNLVLEKEKINNQNLLNFLKQQEDNEYENSYKRFKDKKEIKSKDIGKAKYFENKNEICVLTIHGFCSSPKEMEELSLYLFENGFDVISPRLAGHGIVAEELKNKLWQDWYKSVCRSIVIATLSYKKIFLVGFSTGGLLTLLSTKKCYEEFMGAVCINAALNLNDLRIHTLLPAVSFWNDFVELFNQKEYSKEYVENMPENPETNYSKHYISSVEQLSLLMKKIKNILHKVKKPLLIIQSKNDPIVSPSSAYEIFENIKSEKKDLKIIDSSKHVIIKGENSQVCFEFINEFINERLENS